MVEFLVFGLGKVREVVDFGTFLGEIFVVFGYICLNLILMDLNFIYKIGRGIFRDSTINKEIKVVFSRCLRDWFFVNFLSRI